MKSQSSATPRRMQGNSKKTLSTGGTAKCLLLQAYLKNNTSSKCTPSKSPLGCALSPLPGPGIRALPNPAATVRDLRRQPTPATQDHELPLPDNRKAPRGHPGQTSDLPPNRHRRRVPPRQPTLRRTRPDHPLQMRHQPSGPPEPVQLFHDESCGRNSVERDQARSHAEADRLSELCTLHSQTGDARCPLGSVTQRPLPSCTTATSPETRKRNKPRRIEVRFRRIKGKRTA